MPPRRVTVQTTGREKARARLWAYGYADLALLFGMSENAVRQAVKRGAFDPASLESVVDFSNKRGVRGARLEPSDE